MRKNSRANGSRLRNDPVRSVNLSTTSMAFATWVQNTLV